MNMNVVNELLTSLRKHESIMRAVYFLFSIRFAYFEVWKKEEILKGNGYQDIMITALTEIKATRNQYKIERSELTKYLWDVEPYLAYLLDETEVETDWLF
ncbi:hypothetical protein ASG65_01425 [Bacillus sp. Leaf13]|nr:hypothetical protein ASG65_01425 [Bacillus sp. Leaf13]